ncbi:MAG: HhH-GPD-type base excision DNA repair protein [Acidimicrobiales bacterium]
MQFHLSQDPEADALLSKEPLALLIGMVLDQQVPLEWAFAGPAELKRRLGAQLDARVIASMDPEQLVTAFSTKPALHRYPRSMARRVQELCRVVDEDYGGEAQTLWSDTQSGSQLLERVKKLPGFGDHKAKIFVALLGKQLGVRPSGWEKVSAPFSEPGSLLSVADIIDVDSLARVRLSKQQAKAEQKAVQRAVQRET